MSSDSPLIKLRSKGSLNTTNSSSVSNTSTLMPLPVGASSYSGWRLAIYDTWVLGIVNRFAWKCPTAKHLLPLFRDNIGTTHLDIGVGTGYYLQHGEIPATTHLVLCDLSPSALKTAADRVPPHVEVGSPLVADILEPLPTSDRFASVSMFFLLHCLPGPVQRKTVVFDHIKKNMTPDGVLTGATVLGPREGWVDSWFGAFIRFFVVREGIMDNLDDNSQVFIDAMQKNFKEVEAEIVGAVLLFKARYPRLT